MIFTSCPFNYPNSFKWKQNIKCYYHIVTYTTFLVTNGQYLVPMFPQSPIFWVGVMEYLHDLRLKALLWLLCRIWGGVNESYHPHITNIFLNTHVNPPWCPWCHNCQGCVTWLGIHHPLFASTWLSQSEV